MRHGAFATTMLCLAAIATLGLTAGAQQASDQYTVNTFWTPTGSNPRVLMRGPSGRIWTGLSDGTIRILEDLNQDGTVDNVKLFVGGTWSPHGLAWRANGSGWEIFVAHLTAPIGGTGQITRFSDTNGDDVLDAVQTLILSMPSGAHQVNNIKIDPSGTWLYFAQGATSNAIPGNGALVGRASWQAQNLQWGSPQIEIFSTGLRNAWGIEFHPSGALFATDNGRDDLGPTAPPDEFNLLLQGKDYGFPTVSGMPPVGHPSEAPVGLLEVHASANGFAFDDGNAMTGFTDQVFITQWGGWSGSPPGRIVQANLHQDSSGAWHMQSWPFITGCGRPLDTEIGANGELFFTVQSGTAGWPIAIYRVVPTHGVALKLTGTPEPGQTVTVKVHAPARPGHGYIAAASAGTGPIPTPMGPIGLTLDAVLSFSLTPNPYLVFNYLGTLDANGVSPGTDRVVIPAIPALSGITLYFATVTVHPGTLLLSGISPTARITVL